LPPASQNLPGASPRKTSNKLSVLTTNANAARKLFAGTSGWAYPTWKPGFYPADVPARAFLGYYAGQLNSVEVNYTFRKLPSPAQLQGWLDTTPPGFSFSFKAPQRITHFQRLRESDIAVAEFITSLEPARTAGKLGLLLFQLPPNFTANHARLDTFLDIPGLANLQTAFEFRHASWFSDDTYSILRRHNAALCVAESDDLQTPDVATANFLCYRLRCTGGYSEKQIAAFVQRFASLAKESELYVYFRHEDEPTGALNAVALLQAAGKLEAGVRE
jgi:uncharacterized protein YecE (DUF72 family)